MEPRLICEVIKTIPDTALVSAGSEECACSVMSHSNLAKPAWLFADCDSKLLHWVVCFKHQTHIVPTVYNSRVKDQSMCLVGQIEIENRCYAFIWLNKATNTKNTCKNAGAGPLNINEVQVLTQLAQASSLTSSFPPVVVSKDGNTSYEIKFSRILHKLEHRKNVVAVDHQKSFVVCITHKMFHVIGSNLFACSNDIYIMAEFVCDGKVDCPNDVSDEDNCSCTLCGSSGKHLLYRSLNGDCRKYSVPNVTFVFPDSAHLQKEIKSQRDDNIICENERKINKVFLNDLVLDCTSDEPHFFTLLTGRKIYSCLEDHMLPCLEGHSKCYELKEICVYQLSKNKNLMPCRNGGHLESCKNFQCNIMFKCKSSYCIKWSSVCDDKWDCPQGDDETVCTTSLFCTQMVKCKNTMKKCVHTGSLCDGQNDCPLGDDEILCALELFICPHKCTCLLFAILCQNISQIIINPATNFFFQSIFVHNCSLHSFKYLQNYFKNAKIAHLVGCSLQTFCQMLPIRHLVILNLALNNLTALMNNCFGTVSLLQVLKVNDNQIKSIHQHSFSNLAVLKFVDLTNNLLLNMPKEIFKGSIHLKFLDVRNATLHDIHVESLKAAQLIVIAASDHHLCCVVSHETICLAHRPWHESCFAVPLTSTQHTVYTIFSSVIFTLSMFCFGMHYGTRKLNKCYSFTIMSINASDSIFGTYLVIICVAEASFETEFLLQSNEWKASMTCLTAFYLVLWYTFLSPHLLMFLSLSRLMAVMHPITTNFKRTKFVSKFIGFAYVSTVAAAVSTSVSFKFKSGDPTTGLCLPFVDPTGSLLGIKLIAWFVFCCQIILPVGIMTMHILLIIHVRKSKESIRQSSRENDAGLKVQLILMSTTNFLCWYPSSGVLLAVMLLPVFPIDLLMWSTISSFALHSLVNPSVYFCTCLRKVFKEGHKKLRFLPSTGFRS